MISPTAHTQAIKIEPAAEKVWELKHTSKMPSHTAGAPLYHHIVTQYTVVMNQMDCICRCERAS